MRETLQSGIDVLARAGDDAALLRTALIDIHSALEMFFRDQLAVELAQSGNQSSDRASWQELINLWQETHGLTAKDRETLFRLTKLRNDAAHSKRKHISRAQVEHYAQFVQDFTGVQIKQSGKSITVPPKAATALKRSASCMVRLIALVFSIALLISGYFVVTTFFLNGLTTTDGRDGFDLLEEFKTTAADVVENEPIESTVEETVAPAPPSSAGNNRDNQVFIRVNDRSNVRSGPGMDFGQVGTAEASQEFEVLETSEDGDWYKIELANGAQGWIGSSRVTKME